MKQETQKLLYDAAINMVVSKKTEQDAWEQVCKFIHTMRMEGATSEKVEAAFAVVEQEVKDNMGLKSMPAKWRSAKSHAIAAFQKGLDVIAPSGVVVPKSKLARELRGSTTPSTLGSVLTAVRHLIGVLHSAGGSLSASDVKILRGHVDVAELTTLLKGM
jgi:hypothetical protein